MRAWGFVAVLALLLTGCTDQDRILTVAEAVDAHRDHAQVRGFALVGPDQKASFCSGMLGTYPPQCGDPRLLVVGLSADDLPQPDRDQGVVWTGEIVLTGSLADGVLTIQR